MNLQGKTLRSLGAPARRALEHEGLITASQLAQYTEREILSLHGIGPASLPALREALAVEGLAFIGCEVGLSGKSLKCER